ncbi:MAG: HD domain-containing protein [Bacillota bacterium]
MISFEQIKQSPQVKTCIAHADETLRAMGYTEHSFAHVAYVADRAGDFLKRLGYPEHDVELARIAGYLHDIGNIVNRADHAQSGAIMAFRLLDQMGADIEDIAIIVSAIGNHDESTAFPVNAIAAALILADKTDVRRSRVRNSDFATFDIHDRVNYAVVETATEITGDGAFVLRLRIENSICAVMEYFEIFLTRMMLCRRAADKLGLRFKLFINSQELL